MFELIEVDPTVRVEAVRRQLAQRRNRQILLVIPNEWGELDNTARMRLLQRQAQIQRCELALVTSNEATRKAARELGIPVFARVEDAEGRVWQMDPALPLIDPRQPAVGLPEPPPWRQDDVVARQSAPTLHHARQQRIRSEERYRQPLPLWLQLAAYSFVGLLIIFFVGGFTIYVLPAATITVVPGKAPVNTTVQLTANPDIDAPDLEINLLPGRLIETSIEVTGTIRTTGSTQRATDLARGTVVFVNTGSAPVSIPVGTVVSTGTGTPVRFRTTAAGELPGGIGQQLTVPIEAIDPGVTGNVRANSISVVEGAMRFRSTRMGPMAVERKWPPP
jgi:hypothetical protein